MQDQIDPELWQNTAPIDALQEKASSRVHRELLTQACDEASTQMITELKVRICGAFSAMLTISPCAGWQK